MWKLACLLVPLLVLGCPVQYVFLVNTTRDLVDVAIGDGQCETVTGECSLRAAVQEANAGGFTRAIELGAAIYVLDLVGTGEDAAATGDQRCTAQSEDQRAWLWDCRRVARGRR